MRQASTKEGPCGALRSLLLFAQEARKLLRIELWTLTKVSNPEALNLNPGPVHRMKNQPDPVFTRNTE